MSEENILVLKHWRETLKQGKTARNLVDFHTRHKYLIMARGIESYQKMGKLVARSGELDAETLYQDYLGMLLKTLQLKTTVPKHINVLQHILGYFKKVLSADEKQKAISVFESYRDLQVPLTVPIALLNHFARKYGQSYLQQQVYLNPHPVELSLRNHV